MTFVNFFYFYDILIKLSFDFKFLSSQNSYKILFFESFVIYHQTVENNSTQI